MNLEAANFRFDHDRGPLFGWFSREGLQALYLPHTDDPVQRPPLLHGYKNDARVHALSTCFDRYFAGLQEDFSETPLDGSEWSDFQKQVYDAARGVLWGSTSTYGGLCDVLGLPATSARAVGRALAVNPLHVLIPAFVISELRTGFQIAFLIFVPFLIIDMIVASILMSMGMMMLPPIIVSLPFKILLFVLVDGWYLLVKSLVGSFY